MRNATMPGIVSLLVALTLACAPSVAPQLAPPAIPTEAPTPLQFVPQASSLPTQEPTPQPLPTEVPTPVPQEVSMPVPIGESGGTVTVAGFSEIAHRDVHQTLQEALTALGPGLAYSRLLRLSTGPELEQPNLILECDLCVGWELSPDFIYQFQLRDDVHWHNISPVNGRPVLAKDLVYSYQRLSTPSWPHASLFSSVQSIEAIGPHGLEVKLASADADALLSFANGHSKVVAREVVEEYGDLRESPVVGTGPWLWDSTDPAMGTILNRNPDYFEEGLPFLDRLVVRVIKSAGLPKSPDSGIVAAFRAGLVDVAPIAPLAWQELNRLGPEVGSAVSRQAGAGVWLSLNVAADGLSDRALRRAVFKAIDPWDYLGTAWEGQGFVSVGIPVQDPEWLVDRAEMRDRYFADPAVARDLIAESGSVLPVALELAVGIEDAGDQVLQLAERISEDLRAVGFNPRIRRLTPSRFGEAVLNQRDYQVALGVLPPATTSNSFLFPLLHSGGRWNIAAHEDDLLDRLIERQASEFDEERRQVQLLNIQHRVLDQAYLVSTVTRESRWVHNRELRGFQPNTALSEYIFWSRVWLDRSH